VVAQLDVLPELRSRPARASSEKARRDGDAVFTAKPGESAFARLPRAVGNGGCC